MSLVEAQMAEAPGGGDVELERGSPRDAGLSPTLDTRASVR